MLQWLNSKLLKRRLVHKGLFGSSHLPDSDIKNVAAHRTRHSHVPQTFTGHNHAGDQVRNGRAGGKDGQTHDLLCDANCLTHLREKRITRLSTAVLQLLSFGVDRKVQTLKYK